MMTPRSSCPGGESTPLQGANLRLNYEINNVTDTALGNLARGKPSFCRSDRCLSYRPPGSLLESRGGSILARAEATFVRPMRMHAVPRLMSFSFFVRHTAHGLPQFHELRSSQLNETLG